MLVHTSVNTIWLYQVGSPYSIIHQNVLTPNDFADLDTLGRHSGGPLSTTFRHGTQCVAACIMGNMTPARASCRFQMVICPAPPCKEMISGPHRHPGLPT